MSNRWRQALGSWIGALLLLLVLHTVAFAQEGPRPRKIDNLVRLLQDPEVRSWLETAPITKVPDPAHAEDGLSAWETATRNRIDAIANAMPRVPGEVIAAASRVRADAMSHGKLPVFIVFFGLTAIGLVAESLFARSRPRGGGLRERLLAIAVFSSAMIAVFFALDWPPTARMVLLVSLLTLVVYRALAATLDAVVPDRPTRRRVKVILGTIVTAVAAASLGRSLAIDAAVTHAIAFSFSIIVLALACEAVISTFNHPLRTRIALCLSFLVIWGLWSIGLRGLFWVGVYAIALPSLLRFAGKAAAEAYPDQPGSMRHVLVVRGVRAAVVAAAVAWLAIVWRLNPDSLVHSSPATEALAYGLLKSVVIVLLADLGWHLARSWIDREISSQEPSPDPARFARQARLRTLLPILRNVLAVAVLVFAALIVLAELGVEIGPLLAGAGIFGVAIGFGSQTLVKDVIGGVFYMLDDAFRVGEYIQAKSYKGTVEGFSLRSVRLRHHRGPVYTVPFGELGAVQNMSRDWGVVKFRISVSYDTDLEKARKLTKKIGAALLEDPELGPIFIEPLKMKGLEEFGDYGVVLSFGMMLRPSPLQSMIRRRANLMIREAFQANGIEFATPSVQVGGDDRDGAAAAATAIRAQQVKSTAVASDG
ncbi:mechanosensitive ion channel family protein [Rhizobium sp. ZW T2_16]|uniref:mechanosensitive ion channel family protein n=1 Tax=Rhizobium sp. ZW T2_16 TaxID=3378083 RepID=UPI0038552414